MRKTPLLLSLAAIAVLASASRAEIITGTTAFINGNPITAFADVTGTHLNAVGFQVSGSAVRDPGVAFQEIFVDLPSQGSGTGFARLAVEWNPQGHEPPGIYDPPHFDFHFYYIPDSLRTTIPAGELFPVAPQFLPPGYSQPGPTVPEMGGHAVDLTSPEFNGGSFTHTFIYGYYQGQEIFVEPMLTQAYLEGLAGSSSFTIRQPSEYGLALLPDFVPTRVEYAYDAESDLYWISVGDFIDPAAVPEPAGLAFLAIPAVLWFARRRTSKRA